MLKNVKKYNNIIIFEKRIKKMIPNQESDDNSINSDKSVQNAPSDDKSNNVGNSNKTDKWSSLKKFIQISAEICAIFLFLYGIVANVVTPISKHDDSIQEFKSDISKINNKIDELTKDIILISASTTNKNNSIMTQCHLV